MICDLIHLNMFMYLLFSFVCFLNVSKHKCVRSMFAYACLYVCVCDVSLSLSLPVKRAVGDKGLQKQSSANECKPL